MATFWEAKVDHMFPCIIFVILGFGLPQFLVVAYVLLLRYKDN